MFDEAQRAEIKAIVVEALVEISEREPRTLRENHDYVTRLRESDAARLVRKRQLLDRVAGALVIATVLGLGTLLVAGGLQWLRGNL